MQKVLAEVIDFTSGAEVKNTLGPAGRPSAAELMDYRLRQLIASNLAQAAIIASEQPLGAPEIVDLYSRIFVELYSSSEAQRAWKD
jgi:hypothetical protein